MKKHGMIRRFVISYLIISITVVTCLMPLYIYIYNVLRRQSIEIEQYKMTFLKTELDRCFLDMNNAVYSLSAAHAQNFVLSNNIKNTDYYYLKDISDYIRDIKLQSENVKDIVMYYPDVDVICSVNGLYNSRQFFDMEYNNLKCSYDEWINKLCRSEEFFVIDSVTENGSDSNTFFYCINLLAKGMKNRNIIVFALIDIEKLKYDVVNKYQESHVALVNNSNNEIVYLSENKFKVEEMSDNIKKSDGFVFIKNPGINKNWSYIVRIDETEYMKELHFVWILAALIFITTIIFVMLFSVIFSKRHYGPIKKLVSKINVYDKRDTNYDNEIDYIDNYLEHLNNSINQLAENDKVAYEMIYHKIVEKIILGKAEKKEWEVFLKYKPDFTGEYFTAAKIRLCRESGVQVNNADFNNIIEGVITQYINKIFKSNEYREIVAQNDNEIMYLINSDSFMTPEVCRQYFTILNNALNQFLKIECVVAVSYCGKGVEKIPDINADVNEVFRFMTLLGIKGVLLNDNIRNAIPVASLGDFNLSQIENILKCGGGAVEAYDAFNLILESNINSMRTSDEAEWLLLKIKVMLTKLIDEIVTDKSLSNEFLVNLVPCRTYSELRAAAKQIYNDLHVFLTNSSNNVAENGIEQKIKDFVNVNYYDVNLNVKMISEHFNFHFVYLSHLFREKTGIGISDYIMKVRIEKAKELMMYTNDTIESIILKVGFVSMRTFSRNFKKSEGVSPGAYRENIKKSTAKMEDL